MANKGIIGPFMRGANGGVILVFSRGLLTPLERSLGILETVLLDLPNTVASVFNIVCTSVEFSVRKNGLPDQLIIATSIDPQICAHGK